MKVEVRDAEKSQKELSVELSVEKYEQVFDSEYSKVALKAKIAGFRQGKAPKEKILKEHGHAIRVQALEKLINDSVFEAIQQQDIKALGAPEIKDVKFEDGEPISYKAYVDVFPAVEVSKLEGFELVKEKVIVTDADVDQVIENIRKNQVSYEPVTDRAVQDGDMTVIDFEGRKDGEVIPSATAQNYSLEIGSGAFIPGFEAQLIGMKSGEQKDIEVTFPEQYHEPSLAGQPITFGITMKEIKAKVLPELDDEFAKDVDEKFESYADLKSTIKNELEESSERQADDKLLNDIIENIIAENPFSVPTAMVKEQAFRLAEQTMQQYVMYGMDPARFGITKEKIAGQHMETAEKQVKGALIINHITEKFELTVSDEDIEKTIEKYAVMSKMTPADYRAEVEKHNGMNALRNSINTDKVTAFLAGKNSVTLKETTKEELEARLKAEQENAEEPVSGE
ncbi:trigger factor [Geovibrio thiophilus]|uniref:Trigger factor n=1 Tax=Geovibrio thiophilus TaxID=139438 RepID=A0A410JUW9_9BACT|nr:trigger factor [Geovibrio thiophilus]QAR31871.1 trigger factor [Geovibrio thiophilus]